MTYQRFGAVAWLGAGSRTPADNLAHRFRSRGRPGPTAGIPILLALLCNSPCTAGGNVWTSENAGFVVHAVAIAPTMPPTLYASGGVRYSPIGHPVFKSTNGGVGWRASDAGLSEWERIFSLAIDPTDPSIVYAAGDDVFRSDDGGATWSVSHTGLPVPLCHWQTVVIAPAAPDTLYTYDPCFDRATVTAPLFKSIDGGSSWSAVSLPGLSAGRGQGVWSLAIDPAFPTTVYAGMVSWIEMSTVVFKSIDGGDHWSAADAGITWERWSSWEGGPGGVYSLAIDPSSPTTLYAAATADGLDTVVFKSSDGGNSWSALSLRTPGGIFLRMDPNRLHAVYAVTADAIFKSTDGGDSWNVLNANLPPAGNQLHDLVIDPNTGRFYAATDYGVFSLDQVDPLPTESPTPTIPALTPTPTATVATPSQIPTQALTPCVGDCNGDGQVTISEMVTAVAIALGNLSVSACPEDDANDDARITIDELVAIVRDGLSGCPAPLG